MKYTYTIDLDPHGGIEQALRRGILPRSLELIVEPSFCQMTRHSSHHHFTVPPCSSEVEREAIVLDVLVPGIGLCKSVKIVNEKEVSDLQ